MQTHFRRLGLVPPLLFVSVLLLPIAQRLRPFAPVVGLGGTVAADPPVAPRTLASWHSGALQTEIEASLANDLGLRDWMVRLDNQIRYSLFGVTKSPVIRGPGDWLYEAGYLTARTHAEMPLCDAMIGAYHGLWLAQQVLAENGVTMVLLVTPSKVEALPQHLPFPHRQVHAANHARDIDVLQAILALGRLDHLDAQRLFAEWQAAEPTLPLFPRSGTHWSYLGSARVAVRLLDLLEQRSGVDLPSLDLTSAPLGKSTGPTEDDMLLMANLLDEGGMRDPMPVPVLSPRAGDHGRPHGLLLVSSSFGWTLLRHLAKPAVFAPVTMYYYFQSAYDYQAGERGSKRGIDKEPAALRAEILRYRFVVVECNASQIRTLGFEFPKAVIEAFGMPKNIDVGLSPDDVDAVRRAALARPAGK